jgi:hypothetical protein
MRHAMQLLHRKYLPKPLVAANRELDDRFRQSNQFGAPTHRLIQ